MNSDRIELDGRKRKLILRGDCLELLQVCAAMCCREWGIKLSSEEHTSGQYAAESICSLTNNVCDKNVATCINLTYELKRNADGACIYLDENNKCSIYQDRPKVCRDFTCQGGWRLTSAFPAADDGTPSETKPEKDTFIEGLTDEMTFVPHPLIKLHTVFYAKEKGEIMFLKEMVGTCGKFYTRDSIQLLQLDDDLLLRLILLFDSKQPLLEIQQCFNNQYGVNLAKKEFYEIVWLLNKHNIIIEARNFRGRLAREGRI